MTGRLDGSPGDEGRDLGEPFVVVPVWVARDSRLPSRAVHLYAVIRSYMRGPQWAAFPSRQTLAGHLGVSDLRVVDKAIAALVAEGALHVERRSDGPYRTSNRYTIPRTRISGASVDGPVENPGLVVRPDALTADPDSAFPRAPLVRPGTQEVEEGSRYPLTPSGAQRPLGGCAVHKRSRKDCPSCNRAPWPDWCRECDSPATRLVEKRGWDGDDVVERCPKCHPGNRINDEP